MAMLYDGDKDGFRETVKRVWPQIRDLALAAVEENGLIDKYCEESGDSYAADYENLYSCSFSSSYGSGCLYLRKSQISRDGSEQYGEYSSC